MRRKINAISILCILLILYLSGCISNNGGGEQALDSDGDGYADNVDDFPNDAGFHEKSYQFERGGGTGWNSGEKTTTTVKAYGGHGWGGMVESHWKLVVIKAEVIGPQGFTYEQGKNFSVEVRQEDYGVRLYEFYGPNIYERIPVTTDNYGDWYFSLDNYNKDVTLTVTYEIYKMR